MDRRSNYPYPRRSNPLKSYAEDDDDDNDAVLVGINNTDDEEDDVRDDDEDEDFIGGNGIRRRGTPSQHRHKQRKLSSYTSQFSPHSSNSSEWSEQDTFVLLEVWGERFLQLGRSSLRSEDWSDVADRVSDSTRMKRSVLECRNRLNVLKTKYKREKGKVLSGGVTKWVFFKKLDVLMTMSPRQLQQQEQCGLACGVDSGEFVFMNPKVYLDYSNACDEMRDSPENSEFEMDGEDNEDEEDEDEDEEGDDAEDEEMAEESYRMLSESIKRVGEIYEKIEDSKKQHMKELERMREEFQRELELQKKEMLDRTNIEIAKLSGKEDGDQDSYGSVENLSE